MPLNFDFEDGTWRDWTVQGSAFGESPRQATGWSNAVRGFQGRYFVNTFFNNSDEAVGTARSADFVISGDTVTFLIAGGSSPMTAFELWVGDRRVRAASGRNSEEMVRRAWTVDEFRGQHAYLVIRDGASGSWGHVVLDDIQTGNRRQEVMRRQD